MPQTRAGHVVVAMVTTKKEVLLELYIDTLHGININWGDDTNTEVTSAHDKYSHTYTDGKPSHGIYLEGSYEALHWLWLTKNELIYLNIASNTELDIVNCSDNKLDNIDVDYCPKLATFWAPRNELSFIDLRNMPNLVGLLLQNNSALKTLDVSKNSKLQILYIGGTAIKDIDLSNNINLQSLYLSGLALSTINNLPLSDTSFSIFPKLRDLYVDGTPFSSLDLSKNPAITGLSIAFTSITQLDISNLNIDWIVATSSNLTDLIYTKNNLLNSYEFHLDGTPFESNTAGMFRFITALPDRSDKTSGILFCYSDAVNTFASLLERNNWKVNTYYTTRGVENFDDLYEHERLYSLAH